MSFQVGTDAPLEIFLELQNNYEPLADFTILQGVASSYRTKRHRDLYIPISLNYDPLVTA